MSLKLHQTAYEQAQKLIRNGQFVVDQESDWTDHKPARSAEKRFIEEHGFAKFGKWHLGEDDEEAEGSRHRYRFSYGDFRSVHRCAVLAAQLRAAQYNFTHIELAAAHLAQDAGRADGEKAIFGEEACFPSLSQHCSRQPWCLVADGLPTLDVESFCRTVAAMVQPVGDVDLCLRKELEARDQLAKQWTQFSAADRSFCQQLTSTGADPTYTELLTCLEVQRDARNLREEGAETTGASPRFKSRRAPRLP